MSMTHGDQNAISRNWRCGGCDTWNEPTVLACTICETAKSTVSKAVRDYITSVASGLPDHPPVVYTAFDGPAAYIVTTAELIAWSPTLGWTIGAHGIDQADMDCLHHVPDAAPIEIIHTITAHQNRDPHDAYSDDVDRWHRAHELPSQAGEPTCSHGTGTVRFFTGCGDCEAAEETVRARLAQLADGCPVDVIA
ncbi:hypothetical protein [Nocardiopsis synnemataformans]|uniref:hypothetical protein n=1 Tax=Nocardiopsis synnemataformans TaxID=61305 RepID=UPI003EC05CBD